jgi:hypothetical protein
VFACGDVCGYQGPAAAAEAGARVGALAAAEARTAAPVARLDRSQGAH